MIKKAVKSKYSAIILIIISAVTLSPHAFNHNPLGLPLIVLGAVIYFTGRFAMGSAWSIEVKPVKELINNGLFKHVRHPMYTGLLIVCLGLVFSTLSISFTLLFTLIITPYLYKRARTEEELLLRTLPEYIDYMKRTGMFVPKIL